MIWEKCDFWNGREQDCDDIDPHRFEWWCPGCNMAVRDCHAVDGKCPACNCELEEMVNRIDVYEEYSGNACSVGNGYVEDEEGNIGYPD